MLLTGEAVKLVQEKHPDKRVIAGLDMGTFYAFQMWNRSLNPKSILHFPTTPAMYAVRKSDGHEFLFHAYSSDKGEFKGEIDVAPYLSREDAKFCKYIRDLIAMAGGD